MSVVPFMEYLNLLLVLYIGMGLFAGIIASSVSIKKHLKV